MINITWLVCVRGKKNKTCSDMLMRNIHAIKSSPKIVFICQQGKQFSKNGNSMHGLPSTSRFHQSASEYKLQNMHLRNQEPTKIFSFATSGLSTGDESMSLGSPINAPLHNIFGNYNNKSGLQNDAAQLTGLLDEYNSGISNAVNINYSYPIAALPGIAGVQKYAKFSKIEGEDRAVSIRTSVDELQRKVFLCTWCDYKSLRRDHINIHIRKHTGVKPHTCGFCGKTFSDRSNMNVHMRRHVEENASRHIEENSSNPQ